MNNQISFGELEYAGANKKTRKEIFLEKMDKLVPWQKWCDLIRPDLSDESCEEECISNIVFRKFVGNKIPDETTLGNFRNLLERHKINEKIFMQQTKQLHQEDLG